MLRAQPLALLQHHATAEQRIALRQHSLRIELIEFYRIRIDRFASSGQLPLHKAQAAILIEAQGDIVRLLAADVARYADQLLLLPHIVGGFRCIAVERRIEGAQMNSKVAVFAPDAHRAAIGKIAAGAKRRRVGGRTAPGKQKQSKQGKTRGQTQVRHSWPLIQKGRIRPFF